MIADQKRDLKKKTQERESLPRKRTVFRILCSNSLNGCETRWLTLERTKSGMRGSSVSSEKQMRMLFDTETMRQRESSGGGGSRKNAKINNRLSPIQVTAFDSSISPSAPHPASQPLRHPPLSSASPLKLHICPYLLQFPERKHKDQTVSISSPA